MALVRRLAIVALAFIVPFLLMFLYLAFIYPRWTTERRDELAIAVSTLGGLAVLNCLEMRTSWRIVVSLAFAAVMAPAQFLFALAYVCGAYRACL